MMTDAAFKDQSFGGKGVVYEAGTTAIKGAFFCIAALEDTVIATLEASDWSGDTLTSIPLPAGMPIYGTFNAFTLTSGKVLAYKR